jgi:hypothetical protein
MRIADNKYSVNYAFSFESTYPPPSADLRATSSDDFNESVCAISSMFRVLR